MSLEDRPDGQSQPESKPGTGGLRRVSDAQTMRALTHPVRIALFEQLSVVADDSNVSNHPPIGAHVPARGTFTDLKCFAHCDCRFAPLCRR